MPLRFTVKRKEPRFKGDRPSWSASVSGPPELFSDPLCRALTVYGLSPWKTESEMHIWTLPPSSGEPPLYLAPLLSTKYRARIERATQDMVNAAVEARRPADGVDRLLSREGPADPGRSALLVRGTRDAFLANCAPDDVDRRRFLAGAGWLALQAPSEAVVRVFGEMPHFTRDPFIAQGLEPFMSENATQLLGMKLAAAMGNIRLSKTQLPPDSVVLPVPDGLSYMDFQKAGIAQVVEQGKSAIIADEMGLGKTVQGIGVLNARPEAQRVLVTCQANMRLKWVREIEKWKVAPDLTVGHAEGDHFPLTDVVVINYDIIKRHAERLKSVRWDLILVDEAHNLKNPEAQRTQVVLGDLLNGRGEDAIPLAPGGQILHLTGTPKPNRVSELWPLLTSSRPDIWGRGPEARQAFLNRYEPPILIRKEVVRGKRSYHTIVPMAGRPMRELELQWRLRGSGGFIRRLKRDTDLPPKFRSPIEMPIKLTREVREVLKSVEADIEALRGRLGHINPRLGESRQASAVIDVIEGLVQHGTDFLEVARVRRNLGLLKAPYAAKFILDELAAENDFAPEHRRKTVVFAHHKDVISVLAAAAEAAMPGATRVYDGTTSAKNRQAYIDDFQNDPDVRLFVMSLSGATGITLTAGSRMRVVEPDWSPSNMLQIEDRIWRIGQERSVDIGYLFIPDSLDVQIGNMILWKMEVDEKTMNRMQVDARRSIIKPAERIAPIYESVGVNNLEPD